MLTYVTVGLASFIGQFAVLDFVRVLPPAPAVGWVVVILSLCLLLSQLFLTFGAASKFEELVRLEMADLGFQSQFDKLHESLSSRFWNKVTRALLLRSLGHKSEPRTWAFDAAVIVAVITATLLFILVMMELAWGPLLA